MIIAGAALLASVAAPPVVAAPQRGDQSGFERTVFVHYPRGAAANPDVALAKGSKAATNCPDPSTCSDYKYDRVSWGSTLVVYVTNFSGAGGADYTAAVDASFAAWDSATTAPLFTAGGAGPAHASSLDNAMDGVNSITWEDLTSSYPGAIAVTFIWSSRVTKRIAEVDTVLNNGPGFSWSYTPPECDPSQYLCNPSNTGLATYDVRDILTHEVGHWLELGDLYKSADSELTMYGYGTVGERKKDSLGKGDCLGVTSIYGGACP